MVCVMAKDVLKHFFIPNVLFLMILPSSVLSMIYFSVYKVAVKSLELRMKQSLEHFIEEKNRVEEIYQAQPSHRRRYDLEAIIDRKIQYAYDQEIEKLKISIKFSKGLILISLIFFLTCVPMGVVQIIDEFYALPSFLHLYSFLFTRLCSLFNPIFYGLYSSKFLFGYKNVFNVIYCCQILNFQKYEKERKDNKKIAKKKNKNYVIWRKKDDVVEL